MNSRQISRRALTTLAAVAFAASVSLFTPTSASADGSGGVPPPPPTPPSIGHIAPFIATMMAVQAVL